MSDTAAVTVGPKGRIVIPSAIRAQLGLILEHAARVGEVAADDVPPTAYAIPRANVLRPDVRTESLPLQDVLANAPEVEDDRFKVPRIVEVE